MTPLQELAGALGVELMRPTADGSLATVPDETLLALCRALGAAVARPEDAPKAIAALRAARVTAGCEPVSVAWDDATPELILYRERDRVDDAFELTVELDTGASLTWRREDCHIGSLHEAADGVVAVGVGLPRPLPHGAHRTVVTGRGREDSMIVLAAPRRPVPHDVGPRWGLFAPLYALHEGPQTTTGDLGTLRRFADWCAGHGASVVGTLPLLATFLGHGDEPCDPSPYAPVSRQYWNEAYLDLSSILAATIDEPAPGALVDLPALAGLRRAALEPHARAAETDPDLRIWLAQNPDVTEYARFRSKVEGASERAVGYHEFVQWQCERQLSDLAQHLDAREQSLYLDFPIGTHRDGFDVATNPDLFVRDASVGAPPDAFYAAGQNWGFPPIDPDAARSTGHAHLRACLDAHLRFARVLRLDHVMGLHRLWFVPEGAAATDGAYVRYAAEEQWAAVCLVAARHGAQIVGEDLGTVPDATRRALGDHAALGMWVVQFETPPDPPVPAPRPDQLACTGTHDLPPFAAWWYQLDATRRAALVETLRAAGALDPSDPSALSDLSDSALGLATVLGALYAWMGASHTPLALANLEDLWLETEPQNRPGTPTAENFRRRAAYGIDAFDTVAGLSALLAHLDTARRSIAR